MSEESPILLRRAGKDDIPFITNSWLRSFRDGLTSRAIPNDVYYYNQHRIVEKLLPKCLNVVVCRADDPDQILAYAVAEPTDRCLIFHFIYVKAPFRKLGLATKLVTELIRSEGNPPVSYSHRTWSIKKIKDEWLQKESPDKMANWLYNPFLQWKEVTW